MKNYDFDKAKGIIDKAENLKEASLGMHEDWSWTAETVFENGKFTKTLNEETEIGGISGSNWATPTLQLCFENSEEKMIEVSTGENSKSSPPNYLGAFSQQVQDNITPLSNE